MKILAIRGSNLTSFAGDFALELDRAPLDRLGLFAISGATGAGKSTLLDALCLALFDRTPRLGGPSKVLVGRADEEEEARLSAYDVRGMLRRGAGKGHAEVDFLGKDGRRYRARWNVWRARERAEGRFRPQELSLTDVVSGQVHGRTKGEVLQAIQERLGLSFDQFRRSALLAQGEFAAFLRADASERAELLERMTGTEVYSRLSVAAHEKNSREQEEVKRLSHGLAAIALLSDADREGVRLQWGEEEAARVREEARLREAEAARSWYAQRAEFVGREQEAEAALTRTVAEREAAAPREALLESVRAAEGFRAVVSAVETAEQRCASAEAEQVQRAAQAAAALAAAAAQRHTRMQAEVARAAAQEAEAAVRPALEEAAKLDTRRAEAEREARETAELAKQARAAEDSAREALALVQAAEAKAQGLVDAAQAWRTSYASWEPLATEWPRWQRELERYAVAQKEEQGAGADVDRLGKDVDRLGSEAQARREEHQGAVETEAQALALATHAEAALGEDDGAARRALREALLARQDALGALTLAGEGARAEGAVEGEADAEVKAHREVSARAAEEAKEAAARRAMQEAMLQEARRAQSRAEATQGLASHRAALQEGEACPLCGALEHPYAREGAALEGLVAEAAARVVELESARDAAAKQEGAASVRQATAGTAATQAEGRRDTAARRRKGHQGAWRAARERWLQAVLPGADTRSSADATGTRKAPGAKPSRRAKGQGALEAGSDGADGALASAEDPSSDSSGSGSNARSPSAQAWTKAAQTSEVRASNSNAEDALSPRNAPPPDDAESSAAQAWAKAAQEDVRVRLATLREEEASAEVRATAAREARALLETRRARREGAAEALRKAEDALARAVQAHREALLRREAAHEARQRALTEVSPPFASEVAWQDKLAADPARFQGKCLERVTKWRERVAELEAAQKRLDEEQGRRAREEVRLQSRHEDAETASGRASLKDAAFQEASRARARLLQGRPTQEVRAEVQARLDAAVDTYERAREAAEALQQEEKVATARAEDAVRLRAEAVRALDAAQAHLTERLAGHGTTLEALKALLSRDAAWCDAEARALNALRESVAQARAVLEERRERRIRHEASGLPSLAEADVAPTCEALRADVEARRRAEATLRARLEGDDAARARHGAEARALELRQGEAEVWKTLSDLIGSHDGKKFKVFAQSLTLDALLLHANAHLRELARRYRLERVPGHDLDLQVVDGDMGDEVRSVASLSGGESFLVSLALALGLASLSSETTQVETLFIDEGFGTLDPETLEVALATLDALQATGRQVGIISHVSGLAERIGVQVRVVKQGGGRSRLVVEGDAGLVVPSGQQVA
ncbi:AAA family ATPase [Corallococcus llansteffanensis]|uniref:Nuclease SbcCD subunit C n=1 Tax=Corallococcus llansteffanensis TaxID=2316731 RepID=A0A3A8PW54_9BACT|nr:AAA family ATPase [Corallococcus llansteffanensis]RKH57955.1 nuclease SbcCD subunit C [Corallococcus llansteffanensis]